MRIRILLIAILLLGVTSVFSAPFQNVKKILKQPDGTELHCFASGDEFYNRLHDADGFTIVQAENGYFVYATVDARGNVVPTEYVAGMTDPKTLGLRPNVMISQDDYHKRRQEKTTMMRDVKDTDDEVLNHGVYNNIVVFIKFKGDADMTTSASTMESMFNANGYYDISMNNYFKKATYNQLSMVSHYYPMPEGDKIIAYEDIYPRNYYQPYNPTTNPEGYTNQAEREFPLLKRAIEFIADYVPDTLNIDRNNDGYIDNVIFVVKGNVGDWSDLLWPHMWSMYGEEAYINGKRVGTFNFQLETSSYFSVSTLCHEMSHSLGFPDLYHYISGTDHLSPSGPWDLMCGNANPPQHSSTYMKHKYGTWIDEIPEITEYGTYTIEANSWEGGRRNCYKIASNNPNQFYLLEFRNKNNFFEKGLPSSGLLIYRIDTRYHGCADYNGYDTFDEVYIFRPGGTPMRNGTINGAAFSKDLERTEFNINTDPYPFLNKNTEDLTFNICNISETGDQMTFTYCPIDTEIVPANLKINVNANDKVVELKWDINEFAESYNVYRNGELLVANITENIYKDAYDSEVASYLEYHVTANSSGSESYRSNEEVVFTGDYSQYTISMTTTGDNGWQGGEIVASFDNGMDDKHFTIYTGYDVEKNFIAPKGTKVDLSWIPGWDDTECSFVVTENGETIYASSELQEGPLTEFVAAGTNGCVVPEDLVVELSGDDVIMTWNSMVETENFAVIRNDEIIAENIKTNSYVDAEVPTSGTYNYCVKSMSSDCMSEPSNVEIVSVLKLDYDKIPVVANVTGDGVDLKWEQPSSMNGKLKYGNDDYVTNEGSSPHNWGIVIPSEKLKLFNNEVIYAIEIFDACEADYTFSIYNGEKPHDSVLLYKETFTATNTADFVKFDLSETVSFDNTKDLWIVAKGSKNNPIPCGDYCGDPNSCMIRAGSSWKPATEYNMPYSWLLRAYTSQKENINENMTYNVYRDNEIIASELTSFGYKDDKVSGNVCYKVEALIEGLSVTTSDDICVDVVQFDDEDAISPGLTNDFINIKAKDIVNVKIVSVTGAIVYNNDTNEQSFKIDVRNLRSGTYVVQVTTKTDVYTEKVVVAF
ncbi:MAG: T9SS type A sorting domain-containing protein [Bacteroidales bacterium]|nr:T9SS type A sorting domain-containing protein [Bacteroidales bacterium]